MADNMLTPHRHLYFAYANPSINVIESMCCSSCFCGSRFINIGAVNRCIRHERKLKTHRVWFIYEWSALYSTNRYVSRPCGTIIKARDECWCKQTPILKYLDSWHGIATTVRKCTGTCTSCYSFLTMCYLWPPNIRWSDVSCISKSFCNQLCT